MIQTVLTSSGSDTQNQYHDDGHNTKKNAVTSTNQTRRPIKKKKRKKKAIISAAGARCSVFLTAAELFRHGKGGKCLGHTGPIGLGFRQGPGQWGAGATSWRAIYRGKSLH